MKFGRNYNLFLWIVVLGLSLTVEDVVSFTFSRTSKRFSIERTQSVYARTHGSDTVVAPTYFGQQLYNKNPQQRCTQTNNFQKKITALHGQQNSEDDANNLRQGNDIERLASLFMLILPFLGSGFPSLLEFIRSLPPNSTEQLAAVGVLFGSSRLYLYLMSTTIVVLAAFRGSQDDPRLGQRVLNLTEELLSGKKSKNAPLQEKNAYIQTLSNSGIGESLDEVSSGTQAVTLFGLVSVLLAASVFFLQLSQQYPILDDSSSAIDETSIRFITDLFDSVKANLPTFSKIWNAFVLTLFAKCEVEQLQSQIPKRQENQDPTTISDSNNWIVPWVISSIVTALAFSGIWPAQNFVNMALATLVARAIQINRFAAIVGALTLLTIYDAASVLFIQPAVAVVDDYLSNTIVTNPMALSDTGTSAMGAVAMNKLSLANGFQPGLLVTRIGDKLGGALGLGDAVFPSLLAIFAYRYDTAANDTSNTDESLTYFNASIFGYLVGCFACEFVPFLSTTGVPALLFIAPSMLVSVIATAIVQDELEALSTYNPEEEHQKV